ncbi:putative inorganic phosphate transporter 1-6 [Porphyridium purpureum]|uniref:Putative inorganic phosphate transporter 1-6 n=1 Tax=Porphyridium purpureum TaxID=35688 RepID=A0A5J4Z927_PORPP|nr:putative inorganic phosphate transporter 1-6 [Porphyridium purpureum]|eukprot:POR8842..scf295_1
MGLSSSGGGRHRCACAGEGTGGDGGTGVDGNSCGRWLQRRMSDHADTRDESAWSRLAKGLALSLGFVGDAYDLFVVNLVIKNLEQVYEQTGWDASHASLVASAALVGTLVGQLSFGMLADRFGRRPLFILCAFLTCCGSALSALSSRLRSLSPWPLVIQLVLFRLLLGVGIGGEYPLSATVAFETSKRPPGEAATSVLGVFCMQGVGLVLCPVVYLILLASHMPQTLTWRIALFIGALPSLLAFVLRFRLHESDEYENVTTTARNRVSSATRVVRDDTIASHSWTLFGTASAWFLLDVTFYANALAQSQVTDLAGVTSSLHSDCIQALQMALLALPGYALSYMFAVRLGVRNVQMAGFALLAVLYTVLALFWPTLKTWFTLLYGLTFLFSNFGPNATTFCLAAMVFPTQIRSTCHGISAAAGKAGALIGAAALRPIALAAGLEAVFGCCATISLVGAVITALFIPVPVAPVAQFGALHHELPFEGPPQSPNHANTGKEMQQFQDTDISSWSAESAR